MTLGPLTQLVKEFNWDLEIDLSRLRPTAPCRNKYPDSNLETSDSRDVVAPRCESPFTQLEMLRLTELEARQRDINDLTGT